MAAKHWIGTVPVDSENAKFWENPVTIEHIAYIKLQEEIGHGTTAYRHYQVYLCLKDKKRLTWLKKHIHATAHWEKKRGTVAEAIDYVSKEDTRVPDGIQFEFGEKPNEQTEKAIKKRLRDKDEVEDQALNILQQLNEDKYIRWQEIPPDVQMKPGFIQAYKMATKDTVGPERPDLKIITLIGPPGCGKSYAISKIFPNAGRWLKGNSGQWFCNAKSEVMVFEEFSGQIELQSMLKYLDPYPLALEVKGGTEPANYRLVIITSNTPIENWYTTADEFKGAGDPLAQTTAKQRRTDALAALWDRLGHKPISRTNGTVYNYVLDDSMGPPLIQIRQIREEIMRILQNAKDAMKEPREMSPPDHQPEIEQLPDDIPSDEQETQEIDQHQYSQPKASADAQ